MNGRGRDARGEAGGWAGDGRGVVCSGEAGDGPWARPVDGLLGAGRGAGRGRPVVCSGWCGGTDLPGRPADGLTARDDALADGVGPGGLASRLGLRGARRKHHLTCAQTARVQRKRRAAPFSLHRASTRTSLSLFTAPYAGNHANDRNPDSRYRLCGADRELTPFVDPAAAPRTRRGLRPPPRLRPPRTLGVPPRQPWTTPAAIPPPAATLRPAPTPPSDGAPPTPPAAAPPAAAQRPRAWPAA